MDEYIRRGTAIEETCSDCTERNICGGSCSDTDRLRAIPAVDVVEVVRCRECVFGNMPCAMARYPDYFCADGKRKDGGQEA